MSRPSSVVTGLMPLEKVLRGAFRGERSMVFLHPDQNRDYTDSELCRLDERDYETRVVYTGTNFAGITVFLSNHFTDNVKHNAHFNYVRDLLKAAHATKQRTCAKSTLSILLTMFFNSEKSDYSSYALSMASGLSRMGENSYFEDHPSFAQGENDCTTLSFKLCALMDIVFRKMAVKKMLLDQGKCNIYRVVHCETMFRSRKFPLVAAFFSFFMQTCLTVYVFLKVFNIPYGEYFDNLNTFPLAGITFLYSMMVSIDSIKDCLQTHKLYGKSGPVQMMDFITNVIIPLLLAFCGFIVILNENDYFDAVLNATALLFIPEIDDQLPTLLGLSVDDIVKNYLILKAMEEFDVIIDVRDEDFFKMKDLMVANGCGRQFGDFYITNLPEQGTTTECPFQPHQVTLNDAKGHQINPSSYITSGCLLKKIEWSFTTGYPNSSEPRIGLLRLTKVNGKVVEIKRNVETGGHIGISEKVHALYGMYIITSYQMSEDVIKLRVCGSSHPGDFLTAMKYYALWDLSPSAEKNLRSLSGRSLQREAGMRDLSCYGKSVIDLSANV